MTEFPLRFDLYTTTSTLRGPADLSCGPVSPWTGSVVDPLEPLHRFKKEGAIGTMIDQPLFPRRRPLALAMPIFPSPAIVAFLERLYPHHLVGGMDPQQGVADIGEFIHEHTPLTLEG